MSDTSLMFSFLTKRNNVSPEMKKISGDAGTMASRIKASSIVATAATATMVAGWAALGAQGVAAVAAVAPLAGLLATVPALAIAAAGGVGVLMLATSGLAAAMKQSSGGAASNGQAIVAAERRVQSAQQASTQAQVTLNAARQTAADRLVELGRLLRRAALDERSGILAVTDAQLALRAARQSGDRSAVTHAQLGYDEAVQSLEEIRSRTADLSKEDQHRTAVGVEGSDEVVAALQHQADAVQQLADAQAALKTAGKGSGGVDAAAAAYAKLSTAGKQLVDVLRAIAPQWRTVQQAVQQSVFAGVAGDVKALSSVYLPVMAQQLPAIGKGWNIAFRDTAALAKSAGFVADVNTTLGHTATFWQSIGRSFAPFLSGFRQFAVVGSTFLPGIGSWIERGANAFERWATAARESGRAQEWIANSLVVLSQLWEIVKNLGSSIMSIFRAGSAGPDWLPGLVSGTKAMSDWLASPAGQGQLAAVFTTLRDVGSQLWAIISGLGPVFLDAASAGNPLNDTLSAAGAVTKFLADHLGWVANHLPLIIGLFLAYKAAIALGNVASFVSLPIQAARVVSELTLAAAIRGSSLATGGATTAQWLLNAAMWAFPVLLIVAGIVAIVAGVYLLWTNSAGFRDFFIGMWDHIWTFLKIIGAWFAGPFVDFFVNAWNWIVNAGVVAFLWIHDRIQWVIDTVAGIKDKIAAVAGGMWDAIVGSFKAAINWMIRLWNNFHLTLGGGTVLGVSIPSVTLDTPNLPYLESGGTITRGGAAVVADRNGQGGEVVSLPRGAQVTPLSGAAGPTQIVVRLDITGGTEEWKRQIRKMVNVDGGGNVQVAFGS